MKVFNFKLSALTREVADSKPHISSYFVIRPALGSDSRLDSHAVDL